MRASPPPKLVQVAPVQPQPPTEEEKKKRAADRKAGFISAGIYLAASVTGGVASWLLSSNAPKTVGKAVEPVLNTAVGVGQSAGGRFQETITNPIRSWVFRAATGPVDRNTFTDLAVDPSKVVYQAAIASMVDLSNSRNKLNGRVTGMAESLQLYTAGLQLACNAARKRLAEGDVRGAARHLAGCLVHDHSIWIENSPKSLNIYARIYLELYPYFHKLPADKVAEFRKAVHDEAVRLAGGKRKGIEEYVDAIVEGLTTRSPRPQVAHSLTLHAPGEMPTVSLEGRTALSQPAANDDGGDAELRKLLDEHYTKLMEGKGFLARFKLRRQQKRVTKAVIVDVHERMKSKGRPLFVEEIWRIVQAALNADVSRRIENKITGISFGAFAGTGAASGVGKFYLEKSVSPQIMVGLDAVVFTLVGIAMGTAGSFFQDRFNNIARAFGYGGLSKTTLGPAIERELLDNLLRTWTVDGRILGGRNAYNWYTRYLGDAVRSAESAIKAGELDMAVEVLAGASEYGRRMFFTISPLMEAFDLLFMKLGPHMDCLTTARRDELLQKFEERMKAKGATPKDMGVYHAPFIRGLLLTNVEPKP